MILSTYSFAADAELPVCTGYNPENLKNPWGPSGASSPEALEGNCPPDQAIFSVLPPAGMRRAGEKINIYATCCPVPKGVLTQNHRYELLRCPDGYVATGAKQEVLISDELLTIKDRGSPKYWKHARNQYLRCTEIDKTKYALGDSTKGVQIGFETGFRTAFEPRISRTKVPPALRFALGRLDRARWSSAPCLGLPWGSLLTGKNSKYCSDFEFRQLIHSDTTKSANTTKSTEPGSKQNGSNTSLPVKVFPDCLAVKNPLSLEPQCVTEENSNADENKLENKLAEGSR